MKNSSERCVCSWICSLKTSAFITPSGHPEINVDITMVQIIRFKLDLLLETNPEALPLEIHYFQYKQGINQVKHYRSGSNRNPGSARCVLALRFLLLLGDLRAPMALLMGTACRTLLFTDQVAFSSVFSN